MNIVSYATLSDVPWYFRPWMWGVGAALLLAAGLMTGWLTKPEPSLAGLGKPVGTTAELDVLLAMQNAANDALRTQLGNLERALGEDLCVGQGGRAVTAAIGAAAPPSSSSPSSSSGTATKRSRQELLAQLEAATVLVATDSGSGSGFFVTDDIVVTNAHVVDGANIQSIRITSNALSSFFPAALIAKAGGQTVGDRDYAILRIAGVKAPGTLALSQSVDKLDPVIAAGYPGVYLDVWQQQGGGKGIPPLFPRQGEVVYIQESKPGIPLISHTAEIFHGNSGGPLIDACGRVIGINTFGYTVPDGKLATDASKPPAAVAKVDFAISAQDLIGYLQGNNVAVVASAEPCR